MGRPRVDRASLFMAQAAFDAAQISSTWMIEEGHAAEGCPLTTEQYAQWLGHGVGTFLTASKKLAEARGVEDAFYAALAAAVDETEGALDEYEGRRS